MAINIEVKQRLKALEDRIVSLELKQQSLEAKQTVPSITLKTPKMCPHCGTEPAYFFHVKACQKQKEKTHGAIRSPD